MSTATLIEVPRDISLPIPREKQSNTAVRIDALRQELAKVVSVAQADFLSRQAKAIQALADKAHASLEIKASASDLVLRCERAVALLVQAKPKNKGAAKSGWSKTRGHDDPAFDDEEPDTLEEVGIEKNRAKRLRMIAKLDNETFERELEQRIAQVLEKEDDRCSALSIRAFVSLARRLERGDKEPEFSPLIKPSDNWNFSPVFYDRIEIKGEENGHGYIPGELYANCLWYYSQPNDVVVDPMAGSGQLLRVYEDRATWMRPTPWPLEIRLFDLTPRGPYQSTIGAHDLRDSFPIDHADYIILDLPYYGIVKEQYSKKQEDVANMPLKEWQKSITAIARSCATAQSHKKLCTVISPNYRDTATGEIVLATRLVESAFLKAGYRLHDIAYASRRIQQQQSIRMAQTNIKAKQERIMLTDIAEILTFIR